LIAIINETREERNANSIYTGSATSRAYVQSSTCTLSHITKIWWTQLYLLDGRNLENSMSSLEIVRSPWPIMDRVFFSSPSSKATLNQKLSLNDTPCTTKFLTLSLLKSYSLSTKWLAAVWWVIKHSYLYVKFWYHIVI